MTEREKEIAHLKQKKFKTIFEHAKLITLQESVSITADELKEYMRKRNKAL